MANSDELSGGQIHVGLFPSAGMGHLTPALRLADVLLRRNCKLTLITTDSVVSQAESELISCFLSAFPQVTELKFHLSPLDPTTTGSGAGDPFFLQFETIRRSAHRLSPLLAAASPPLSALICDVSLITPVLMAIESLSIQIHMIFTSSAKMFSLFAHYPQTQDLITGDFLHIPGIGSIPKPSLPPFITANNILGKIFKQDSQKIKELSGILINTFDGMEDDSLAALNNGEVLDGLPPVTAIGPLTPCEFENQGSRAPLKWLDGLPPRSVVFACFGSRTALSRDQIKEIGTGLISSGYNFIWVVKDSIVDKEDKDELGQILGEELLEKMNEKGKVMKYWVNQSEILGHRAIGGFISHCGWNSVVEAAAEGVPILAWPQHGDQKLNADVIAKKGVGIWAENWGWGREILVKGEELAERMKEMMESEELRRRCAELKEEAKKAVGVGGRDRAVEGLIENWKPLLKN